ncbi:MAG: hypothetical protein H7Y15_18965 [Pseudonocardia sp.]|nr:hypothetical protein [Pseudonocardia sp.]
MTYRLPRDSSSRRNLYTIIFLCLVAAAFCVVPACVFAARRATPQLPLVATDESGAIADRYAVLTASALGVVGPDRGGSPEPCTPDGNGPGRNTYRFKAIYRIDFVDAGPSEAVDLVHDEWVRRGFNVGTPEFNADGTLRALAAGDPETRYTLFLDVGRTVNSFTLVVTSPCLRAPPNERPF